MITRDRKGRFLKGSRKSSRSFGKGDSHTEKSKRKMSESSRGQKAWNKGLVGFFKHSKEFRLKLSKKYKGIPKPKMWLEEMKENPNFCMRGKTHSLDTKKKMSATRQNIDIKDWKGFTTSEKEKYDRRFNNKFKKIIKERDNNSCIFCKKEKLVVHHIDYNKKNTTPLNCLTLCTSHNIIVNSRRDLWKKLFRRYLELFHYNNCIKILDDGVEYRGN